MQLKTARPVASMLPQGLEECQVRIHDKDVQAASIARLLNGLPLLPGRELFDKRPSKGLPSAPLPGLVALEDELLEHKGHLGHSHVCAGPIGRLSTAEMLR